MKYEVKKLIQGAKQKLIIFTILIFACVSQVMINMNTAMDEQMYQAFYQSIENASQDEILIILDEMKQEIDQAMVHRENANIQEIAKKETLYKRVLEEYNLAYHYDEWRIEQEKAFLNTNNISVFDKGSNFQKEASNKSFDRYQALDVQFDHVMQPSFGLETMIANPFIDLFILAFIGYAIVFVYLQEEHSEILNFVRIQKIGRKKVFIRKFFAITSVSCMLLLCMYISTSVVTAIQFGFPTVSQACQSVLMFKQTTFALSLWQMLLLIFVVKCFVMSVFLSMVYCLSVVFKNIFLAVGIFLSIQFFFMFMAELLYESFTIFYQLQITQMMHPERMLHQASYLNLFDYALDSRYLYAIFLLVGVVCLWIGNRLFPISYKAKKERTKKKANKYHSIFAFEQRMIFKTCCGGVMILLGCFLLFSYTNTIKNVTYLSDVYFNYYVDTIGTKANDDAVKGIEQAKADFVLLKEALNTETNRVKQIELQGKLQFEEGLLAYEQRVLYLKENYDNATIIKEDQVRFVMEDDFIHSLLPFLSLSSIVICCYLLHRKERNSGMAVLKQCYPMHAQTRKQQTRLIFIMSCGLYVLLYGILLVKNIQMYGWNFFTFMSNEYTVLENFPVYIPLSFYICLHMMYGIALLFVFTKIFYTWASRTRELHAWLFFVCMCLTILLFEFSAYLPISVGKLLFYPPAQCLLVIFFGVLVLVCGMVFNKHRHRKL